MNNRSNREVEFRKIPSLDFLYEVSEDGRIVRNVKSKHQLATDKDRGGYYRVSPVLKGKQVHRFVHVLVAECWRGPKPEGYQVDHIDHDKHNNHYKNLRYVTRADNLKCRVFTEEGKAHNGKITRERYNNATPERKAYLLRGIRAAWENDDGTLRRRQKQAVRNSYRNASPEEQQRRIAGTMLAISKPVVASKDGTDVFFPSKAACARYIEENTGIKFNTVSGRLNAKRRNIGGYDITYTK